jgi:hypothetical protein
MKIIKGLSIALASLAAAALVGIGGVASAAPQWCIDAGGPPCKGGPGGGGEPVGTNNLSYPVIWSDNVTKSDFTPSTAPWTFATITTPTTECVQQDPPVATVSPEIACYYGEKNLGLDEETDGHVFEPPAKIWWLQQRQTLGNNWQVFNITDAAAEGGASSTTPVVVTGIDTGDLLESSITISAKQIRTEFTLLKRVTYDGQLENATDSDYTAYLAFNGGTCVLEDNSTLAPNNCFAAHNMSGAVPGTDQSINEIQGTDYGEITQGGLIDPQLVKVVKNYFDPTLLVVEAEEPGDPRIVAVDPPVGIDATVYSACARLIIQRITDPTHVPVWSSTAIGGVAAGEHGGYWTNGNGIDPPLVDVAAWDGTYSAETNAGGSVIYGYNWNTKEDSSGGGDYRLTFVLEGDACDYDLNTVFDSTTKSVNVGERRPARVMSADDLGGTGNEGGLVYVDVNIAQSGGGGGGGGGGGKGGR